MPLNLPASEFGITPDVPFAKLPGDGTFSMDVVGESHYLENLERVAGQRGLEGAFTYTDAYLFADDSIQGHPSAVRAEIRGLTVGYLPSDEAKQARGLAFSKLPFGTPLKCRAHITGGWDRGSGNTGHFGVKLDVKK